MSPWAPYALITFIWKGNDAYYIWRLWEKVKFHELLLASKDLPVLSSFYLSVPSEMLVSYLLFLHKTLSTSSLIRYPSISKSQEWKIAGSLDSPPHYRPPIKTQLRQH